MAYYPRIVLRTTRGSEVEYVIGKKPVEKSSRSTQYMGCSRTCGESDRKGQDMHSIDTSAARVSGRGGFTLVELLVTIAIIALLISILLPALKSARSSASTVREMAMGQQLGVAYHAYAADNKLLLLPGMLRDTEVVWGDANTNYNYANTQANAVMVVDDRGRHIDSYQPAARYPWRIAPYINNYDWRGLYSNTDRLNQFLKRKDDPKGQDMKSKHYALSTSPTFGINDMSESVLAACDGNTAHACRASAVRRVDQVDSPSRLIIFATARTLDEDKGPFMNSPGAVFPTVDGHHLVSPPRFVNMRNHYDDVSVGWEIKKNADLFGNLDLRHNKTSLTVMFDGSVSRMGLKVGTREGLRDMRHWRNEATTPDWTGILN